MEKRPPGTLQTIAVSIRLFLPILLVFVSLFLVYVSISASAPNNERVSPAIGHQSGLTLTTAIGAPTNTDLTLESQYTAADGSISSREDYISWENGTNPIPNWSFEYRIPNPGNWQKESRSGGQFPILSWAPGIFHHGEHSAVIIDDSKKEKSSWVSAMVPTLEEDRQLEFSGWIYAASLEGKAYINLAFYDGGKNYLSGHDVRSKWVTHSGEWVQRSGIALAPDGAAFVRVECSLVGAGAVYFDEVILTGASEETPILNVEQKDEPDPVKAGGALVYYITYSNTGQVPAADVLITDTFDNNVTPLASSRPFDRAGSHWWSWNVGQLSANGSDQIVVTTTVNTPLTGVRMLSNRAVMSGCGVEAIVDEEPTTITATTELSACLSISAGSTVIVPQSEAVNHSVTFTHMITNCGIGTDTVTVTVESTMPLWLVPTLSPFTVTIPASSSKLIEITARITRVPEEGESPGYLSVRAVSWTDDLVVARARDEVDVQQYSIFLPSIRREYPVFCNGDFETGNSTCWVEYETTGFPVSVTTRVTDPSYDCFSTYAVRIGNSGWVPDDQVPVGHFGIAQTVMVSDVPSPRLEFDYCAYSFDVMIGPLTGTAYDSLEVAVGDPYTYTWRTGNPDPYPHLDEPWASDPNRIATHKSIDLSAYRGKPVTIYFLVWNRVNPIRNTWAYIDNIDGDFQYKR